MERKKSYFWRSNIPIFMTEGLRLAGKEGFDGNKAVGACFTGCPGSFMLLREPMAMGATWKTKADTAGRSDATPHPCGIFPSFLFSSISAVAESEQGMRPVA